MTIYIKDRATSDAVRKLAELRGTSLTEAIRVAVEGMLKHEQAERNKTFLEKLEEIQARVREWPPTGLKADKAFYDSLNDED